MIKGRAERRRRAFWFARRNLKFALNVFRWEESGLKAKTLGRLKERHPGDCGRTQCVPCHCDKLFHEPSTQEMRAPTVEAWAD